jgi:hypothetical protein
LIERQSFYVWTVPWKGSFRQNVSELLDTYVEGRYWRIPSACYGNLFPAQFNYKRHSSGNLIAGKNAMKRTNSSTQKKIYWKRWKKGAWLFWLGRNGDKISIINKCTNSTSHVFSHAYLHAWFQASHL